MVIDTAFAPGVTGALSPCRSPLWGIAPSLLKAVGLGSFFGPWLGQESTALLTVSLISVWQFVGIPMMLIYAALLNIPDDLLDAATVDGAGPFSVFWFVRLPLIAVVGMWLYDEPLRLAIFAGAALIIAGNLLNLRAETRRPAPQTG